MNFMPGDIIVTTIMLQLLKKIVEIIVILSSPAQIAGHIAKGLIVAKLDSPNPLRV